MPLRRRSLQRIRTFAYFIMTYGIVGLIWEGIETGGTTAEGPLVGVAVGITLAALEESRIGRLTRSMPFTTSVVVKSILYLAVLAIPVLIAGFVGGLLQGSTTQEFVDWIASADVPMTLVIIYPIHLVVSFARHLNRLLGPRTLLRYLLGTYHRPRVERRVFMFLDMRSSTMLAEKLGSERYFSLLNSFFRDSSEAILEREAEIYQYVGDELVLTWPVEVGLKDANCIRVFFEILAEVERRREYYLTEFGHVPEFKAGIHFGDVITAEVGDLKKDIVYNGDVLNTTARIESLCNEYGHQLIASEALVSQLKLPSFIAAIPLGPVVLRGKAEAIPLMALPPQRPSERPQ
jgi:adenylate cyclase